MADYYVDNKYCTTLTGTITFTNGSTAVTGSGTAFTTECAVGGRIKLQSDDAGEDGVNWATIDSITDDEHLTLTANYQGSTGSGTASYSANDGTSKDDAWVHARDALEYSGYSGGDVIWFRRGQVHEFGASHCTLGSSSNQDSIITHRADDGTKWPGEGALAQPKITFGTNNYGVRFSAHFVVRDLHFHAENTTQLLAASNSYGGVVCIGCKFEQDGAGSTNGMVGGNYGRHLLIDCDVDFDGSPGSNTCCLFRNTCAIRCTIDGGQYAAEFDVWLEDCVIGATTPPSVAMIKVPARWIARFDRPIMRNNVNHATLDYSGEWYGYPPLNLYGSGVCFEDWDGSKGAWFWLGPRWCGDIETIAASSTPAGQRSDGSATVLKHVHDNVEWHPDVLARTAYLHEQVKVVSAGTYTVTVYMQPTGWGTPPDVNGEDAELWVLVLAWDSGNNRYEEYDSRNEAQTALSNNTWCPITVSNVVADVDGTIRIQIYQRKGDGSSIVYFDPTIEVS